MTESCNTLNNIVHVAQEKFHFLNKMCTKHCHTVTECLGSAQVIGITCHAMSVYPLALLRLMATTERLCDLPLDVVVVAQVVPLHLFLHVVEYDDRGDEVDDLTGR